MSKSRKDASEIIAMLLEAGKYVFTSADIREMLNASPQKTRKLLRRMEERRLIRRLGRGLYLLGDSFLTGVPPELIVSSLADGREHYLGLYTAMRFWALTDKAIQTHFIITTDRSFSMKEYDLLGFRVKVLLMKPSAFFGFVSVPVNAHKIKISNREKTLVDMLYFIKEIDIRDGFKAVKLCKKLDIKRLVDYARKLGRPSIAQRLGYILSAAGIPDEELEPLRALISSRYYLLDPKGPKTELERDSKWRVIVNVKLIC